MSRITPVPLSVLPRALLLYYRSTVFPLLQMRIIQRELLLRRGATGKGSAHNYLNFRIKKRKRLFLAGKCVAR